METPLSASALQALAEDALRRGDARAAAAQFRQLLQWHPDSPQSWNYRGTAAFLQHQFAQSAQHFARSLAQDPQQALTWSNRGLALAAQGLWPEALDCHERALALQPGAATLRFKRAEALAALGRQPDALAGYTQALLARPQWAEALNNRGAVLLELQRPQDALADFDAALALQPHNAQAWVNRGNALQALQREAEALGCYDQADALAGRSTLVSALNRAAALLKLQRAAEALAVAKAQLAGWASGEMPPLELLLVQAQALHALGDGMAAVQAYQALVQYYPGSVEAHYNLGVALQDLHLWDPALASLDRALALNPQHGGARWNKALLLLLQGDFAQGWEAYESGWAGGQRGVPRHRHLPAPSDASSLAGKRLLIHPEQGLGDFIQCCRYALVAQQQGAEVVLETPQPLVALLRHSLPQAITVVPQGAALPPADLQCPVMGLPRVFGTRLESVPTFAAYLQAPPDALQTWQVRLGPRTRPRIGLVWSGNPQHRNDARRSLPLATLLPLLQPAWECHAVHKEVRLQDQACWPPALHDHRQALHDFADTAGLLAHLDLVITVDTAIAHLAGALGRPVWVLLPFSPDYRWLLQRSDSPWYPSARLYRQSTPGDWDAVVHRICADLQRWAQAG